MKRFAVAYINFMENDMELEVVEAQDWQGAVLAFENKKGRGDEAYLGWLKDILAYDDFSVFRATCGNGEVDYNVIELPTDECLKCNKGSQSDRRA